MPVDGRPREPKACQACAQAKVRCEPETPNGCKRCLRLRRTCVMQPPGAHKRKPRESSPSSDVTRLEQKLDDMTAIFTAASRKLLGATREEQQHKSPSAGLYQSLEDILPDDEEGARALSNFRSEVTPYFPFVTVPEDITLAELRQRKPFLFSTIAMVTCYEDSARQYEMAKSIKQYISTDIMMKEECRIDLLQGLLIFLGWYHLQVPIGVHVSHLLHITMSMMTDLGLHKKPPQNKQTFPIIDHGKTSKYSTQRTLDGRRAYLGCFYLNCVITMCVVDIDPMRYTGYTEECCRLIEEAAEYPSDLFLVQLVRMHRMTDRIHRTFNFYQNDPTQLTLSAPIGLSVRHLENELHPIDDAIRGDPLTSSFLKLHYLTLELRLYAIGLDDDFPPERYENYPMRRLDLLWHCLLTAKSYFNALSYIPFTDYFRMPYPVIATFMHAIGVLSRLVLFTGEEWDRDYARHTLDFQNAVDMSIGKLQELVDTHGSSNLPYKIPGAFARLLPRVNLLKEIHEMRRQAIENNIEAAAGRDSTEGTTMPFTYDFSQDLNFMWPGDIWWQEFMPQ